jgi:hypothetical protein
MIWQEIAAIVILLLPAWLIVYIVLKEAGAL